MARDPYKTAKWHWIQVKKQELKIILKFRILFWKILLSSAHCGSIYQIIASAINISVAPLELASLRSAVYDFSAEKSHKKKVVIASHSWEEHCSSWIWKAVPRTKYLSG